MLAWLVAVLRASVVLFGLKAAFWALWQLLDSTLPLAAMDWSTYFGGLARTGLPFVTAVIASAAVLGLSVKAVQPQRATSWPPI